MLLIASRAIVAESVNLSDLPLQGTRERPLIVLELGRTPPATTAKKVTTKVAIAKLTAHEGTNQSGSATTISPPSIRGLVLLARELLAVLEERSYTLSFSSSIPAVRCGPLGKGTRLRQRPR